MSKNLFFTLNEGNEKNFFVYIHFGSIFLGTIKNALIIRKWLPKLDALCREIFLLWNSIPSSLYSTLTKFINIAKIQTWLKDWISNLFHKYFISILSLSPFFYSLCFHLYYTFFVSRMLLIPHVQWKKFIIWEVIFSIYFHFFFTFNEGTIFINKYWFGNLKGKKKASKSKLFWE